jgi:hypothetical protein
VYVQNGDDFEDLGEYGHLNRNHAPFSGNCPPQKDPCIVVCVLVLKEGYQVDQNMMKAKLEMHMIKKGGES